MRRISLCLLSLISTAVWASPPEPVVPNAVPDRFRPLAFDNQKLAGLLVNRLRANSEGFLEHVDLSLLQAGRAKSSPESQAGVGGEFTGRFLQAAAHAYEYRHDPQLKERMDQAATQLLAFQKKNGRFGSFANESNWTPGELVEHRWILLGLLNYWRATGEEEAYTSSQMLGDLLVQTLGAKGKEHPFLEKGDEENRPLQIAALQMVGSLTFLYRYTADPDYLDLCKSIVRSVDLNTVFDLSDAKENLPDTLSSLAGLADLYRLTGAKAYLSPVLRAWKDLAASFLAVTGAPSASESSFIDNCTTVAWMQLTLDLLRITGEPQYGQQLERTLYNQLLSAQDGNTGRIAAKVAFSGEKAFSSQLSAETARCMLSEAEGLTLIPETIWGRYADGILINTYTAGRATVQLRRRGLVQIYSEGSFPETGEILLHVEPSHNLQFLLALRVPEWTSSFTVDLPGQHLVGTPGELLTIHREWKRGDRIKVSIAMSVRVLDRPDGKGDRIALQRGPQILALSKTLNPGLTDLSRAKLLPATPSGFKLSPAETALPSSWYGDQVYKVDGEYQGKKEPLLLVPFADALSYQVWLEKPYALRETSEE